MEPFGARFGAENHNRRKHDDLSAHDAGTDFRLPSVSGAAEFRWGSFAHVDPESGCRVPIPADRVAADSGSVRPEQRLRGDVPVAW